MEPTTTIKEFFQMMLAAKFGKTNLDDINIIEIGIYHDSQKYFVKYEDMEDGSVFVYKINLEYMHFC